MNAIRQTQLLNKRELENATPPSASWHADYRDTAWVYVGGLHLDLTEGDVCIIFSQYGNPSHLNLIRDKETGKSKGFGFVKYDDQRSCDLAVDNLGGAEVLGRLLRVDHTRYKKRDDEDEDTWRIERLEGLQEEEERIANGHGKRGSDTEDDEDHSGHRRRKRRHILKEEQELEEMLAIKEDGEEDDPMREYLIREKEQEVQRAREKADEKRAQKKRRHHHKDANRTEGPEDSEGERRHGHRLRHRERSRNDHERSKDRVEHDTKKEPREDRGDDRHKQSRHGRRLEDSRERRSSEDRHRDRDRERHSRRFDDH